MRHNNRHGQWTLNIKEQQRYEIFPIPSTCPNPAGYKHHLILQNYLAQSNSLSIISISSSEIWASTDTIIQTLF